MSKLLNKLLGKKKYQITPIELVKWAEPLFGEGEKPAEGFPEALVASYEAGAGLRLPAALRDFLLACGKASLNRMLHRIAVPHQDAAPFDDNLTFSHEYLADELDCNDPEDDTPEQKQLRALPRERWGELTGNYLLICWENQGSWCAGIRKEDLDQPDPAVWQDDDMPLPTWTKVNGSVSAHLMGIILEAIIEETTAESDYIDGPAEIQATLKKYGVDPARLKAAPPFAGGEQLHTCLDTRHNRLFVYHEADEQRPEGLTVISEWNLWKG